MKHSIEIDRNNKIFYYSHEGHVNPKDIGKVWKKFMKYPEFTSGGFNLFTDYTKATYDIKLNEIDNIISHLEKIKNIINGKKHAIVTKGSYSTAATLIFEEEVFKKTGFNVKTFSTKEAAFKWLIGLA